jgi:hypothetical protein
MKKKIAFFILPIIALGEIILFNEIAELLRRPSDIAVVMGVILICIASVLNFYLIKLFVNKD